MAKRFKVEAVFSAVDKMTRPISRMQARIGRFTRTAGRNFDKLSRSVNRFNKGMQSAAAKVGAGLVIMGAGMAKVINTGMTFEQTLVNAMVKFPGEIRKGTVAFRELEDVARQIGRTTEFTASQGASALNFLAAAGFNAKQAIVALPGVVDLATVAQIDLGEATDMATDTLGAFGLMTKDTAKLATNLTRVNDVLAKGSTSANFTVREFFEAMKEGGPVAVAAGVSIETFGAMVATMADAGTKGATAGVKLKNIFIALSAPVGQAATVLQRLGIATQKANGDNLDILETMGKLKGALKDMGNTQQLKIVNAIFGKIPLAAALTLMEKGTEGLKAFRQGLEEAGGASAMMAAVMRDTTLGSFKTLLSSIEAVSISIFTLAQGPIESAISRMTEWVRANEDLIATNIGQFISDIANNFTEIVDVMKKVATGVIAFIGLNLALKAIVLTLAAINLVLTLNPIVRGIMIIAGAAALLMGAWEPVKTFFAGLFDVIGDAFGAVSKIATALGFGVSVEELKQNAADSETPRIVSSQERVSRSIEEKRTVNTSEITIRDDTGRAEQTGGVFDTGINLYRTAGIL